ncbi:hypothetical protein L596_010577 [Steinernema carpocapsae]|uniref:START domain-containing protein n=1 Tax=Steinernema carpocapsae TaxID=34508 RepID=A0A4U5PJD3_STECR|nr:hypothetical protein L596_010577 [Steinernema carpocapsae]
MASVDLFSVVDTLTSENIKYQNGMKNASEALKEAYDIFNSEDFATKNGWKKEAESHGDVMYSKMVSYGKMFGITVDMPLDYESIFQENWVGLEQETSQRFDHIYKKLTDHVDIVHTGNSDMVVVKGRDIVACRMWRKVENVIYMAGRSFKTDDLPETKDHIRATMHLCGNRYQPDPNDPTRCRADFVMCFDLKGWIPVKVINALMGSMILKDVDEHKKKFQVMRDARNA